jgi:LPXTG-motif cell wall-anchored protein
LLVSVARGASRVAFTVFASEGSHVAEIPIQRKERSNIWPLLLGLLVLAAVVWFVLSRRQSNDTATARADSAAVVTTPAVRTDSAAGAVGGTMTPDTAARAPR